MKNVETERNENFILHLKVVVLYTVSVIIFTVVLISAFYKSHEFLVKELATAVKVLELGVIGNCTLIRDLDKELGTTITSEE